MDEIYFANLLLKQIQKHQTSQYDDLLYQAHRLEDKFKHAADQISRIDKALSHKWMAAAQLCRNRLEIAINDMPWMISNLKQYLDRRQTKEPVMKDILAEFTQITQELGDIRFDRKNQSLSITTDTITLEEVYLGDFEIRLDVDRIAEMSKRAPYRVIALNPHPAAASSEVTHPHVSGQILCEGEGSAVICNALRQGRLFDFFNMVINILNTYNSGSPYVRLEEWEGSSCYDCGRTVSDDGRYYCNDCDNEFCDHCSTYCQMCEGTVCHGCAGKCQLCEAVICRHCIKKCKQCGNLCCSECIENGICKSCQEEIENEQSEQQQTINDETTTDNITEIASVQSDGLGQAAILPGPIQQ
jgi:hypothetical protein